MLSRFAKCLCEVWKSNLTMICMCFEMSDGSCAVVELEFDYARDKHKAERSWRSICIAFQAVLSTAVELRIALSDIAPNETEVAAGNGEAMVDMELSPSAQPMSKETVNYEEDPNPDAAVGDDQVQGAPPRRHRRRVTKSRKHHHASEFVSSSDPNGVTPRRPPNRRRRVKRTGAGKATKPVDTSTLQVETTTQGSTSFTREMWDSITMDSKPQEKKLLSTMMEEPQSEIEDLQAAQKKIMKQKSHMQFRNDNSLAIIERTTL